ncbi:MAG: hypothetical protein ACPGSM_14420 [Thiolinea sp.]
MSLLEAEAPENNETDSSRSGSHRHTAQVTHAGEPLSSERLKQAKRSYITQRFNLQQNHLRLLDHATPKAGDLVLARIERLGQHKRLEDPNGRRRFLHVGDEVLLCYAPRYATDQFEAVVPEDLNPCQMVAAGGIAAACVNRHGNMRRATDIKPLGLIANAQGIPLNLKDFAHTPLRSTRIQPLTIGVLGTSMNSGKTTTAAALARSLTQAGRKVGVGKITGTGSGGDIWQFTDAGAHCVMDFSDFGYASTFQLSAASIEKIAEQLVTSLTHAGADLIILEVADGIFFEETARLAKSECFRNLTHKIMLTARDTAGAIAGEQWLNSLGIPPFIVAGTLTSSPLVVKETQAMLNAPVMTLADIADGALCEYF